MENITAVDNHYDKLATILGKKYIKSEINNPFDFIAIASKGLNTNVLKNFKKYFNLTREDTADFLQVSEPTIYRWLREGKTLKKNYSIQLLELTDLFLYGIEVFEDEENFFQWLDIPNTALGNMQPKALLELPNGIAKVRNLLGRIEYGVYS